MTDERPLRRFEELDWRATRMGELTLRRRRDPVTGQDVYEVKLGDEYLMSSQFTVAERELARLGLAATAGAALEVLVGGLGLGYTAAEALADDRVARLTVVDALPAVIDWHQRRLLPVSEELAGDRRCRLVEGDFFDLVRTGTLGSLSSSAGRFDAVLLDVDHTPSHVLDPSHADLYTPAGLARLAEALRPGGVFALWSDESAGPAFLADLGAVLDDVEEHEVAFANPLTGGTSRNVVYVARRRGD